MAMLHDLLTILLNLAWFIVVAHFIMSWLIQFQVLNLRQPVVAQIWFGLTNLLEPVYRPIRRFLPDMGGIDLSPLIVLIAIQLLSRSLARNAAFFG